ncbi:MAG: response regulator [Myxococcaceae bacterium]
MPVAAEPRPRRVLVVDDSAVIRDLIKVNLELEGFEVTAVDDGEAALERVAELRPDVVTLDVVMERRGGFETLAALRQRPETADIPVVIVTGRAQAADQARGRALGVDAYLTKPFEPSELVAVVSRLAASGREPAPPR